MLFFFSTRASNAPTTQLNLNLERRNTKPNFRRRLYNADAFGNDKKYVRERKDSKRLEERVWKGEMSFLSDALNIFFIEITSWGLGYFFKDLVQDVAIESLCVMWPRECLKKKTFFFFFRVGLLFEKFPRVCLRSHSVDGLSIEYWCYNFEELHGKRKYFFF